MVYKITIQIYILRKLSSTRPFSIKLSRSSRFCILNEKKQLFTISEIRKMNISPSIYELNEDK